MACSPSPACKARVPQPSLVRRPPCVQLLTTQCIVMFQASYFLNSQVLPGSTYRSLYDE